MTRRYWLAVVVCGIWGTSASTEAAPTGANELTNELRTSSSCRNCHTFDNLPGDEAEPSYAPITSYQGSMMANAARDPVFWAGVALASQDDPEQTPLCVRCHAPKAFLEGRGTAIAIDELTATDQQGIVCELCHRMVDEGNLGNAQYTIDDVIGPLGNVPRRGPWTYRPGAEPPHDWMEDTFIGTSELCGTCHDVTTVRERVDHDGVGMGVAFNEQRTYREWANSALAVEGPELRTCQDCHLPAVADVVGCGIADVEMSHATGGRRHDLVGANRFMVEMLRSLYGSAGSDDVDDEQFDHTLARMDELLSTAATLDIAPPTAVDLGVGLSGLEITVTNNTGHKLPTGYSEGREMWLEVIATYDDQTLYASGSFEPGVGLRRDPQLRTYRAVAEEYATQVEAHLLLNDHWIEDTRIPPAGLVPDIETDPVGDRYTLLESGTWPNFDVVTYAFAGSEVQDSTPQGPADDALIVTVRLLYLINAPEYIDILEHENYTNEAGADLANLFDSRGGAVPMVLAEQTVSIPIEGFFEPSGTSSTGSTSTSEGVDETAAGASTVLASSDAGTGSSGAGAPSAEEGDSGCDCRSGPTSPASWFLWMFLLHTRRRRE